jgi:hypothetical protein
VSVVSVTYARNLGPVERLVEQEWTDETASGRVALCCARCAAVFDLDEFHRVDEVDSEGTGLVVPAVRCAEDGCVEFGYVRLKNYAEPVVRVP